MSKATLDIKVKGTYTITKDGKLETHVIDARIERDEQDEQDELTAEQDVRMAHIEALTDGKQSQTSYGGIAHDVTEAAKAIQSLIEKVKS